MDYSYGLLLEALMDQPTRHRTTKRFQTATPSRARRWHTADLRSATPRRQLRARTT